PLRYEAVQLPTRPAALSARDDVAVAPRTGKAVLAIDDDAHMIDLLREDLTEAGYHVIGAASSEEGLQIARALRPFAITLDILMPQQDGWQMLHALKTNVATRDIPIIVLSIVDNKELAYRLGAFECLLKPVDREAMLATLARIAPPPHDSARQVKQ